MKKILYRLMMAFCMLFFVGDIYGQGNVNLLDSLKAKASDKNVKGVDKIKTYSSITNILVNKGLEEYKTYLDTLKNLVILENTGYTLGLLFFTQGHIYRIQGNLDSAKISYKEAEKLLVDNPENLHKVYNNLAIVLNDLGKKDEAINYLNKCIVYFTKQNKMNIVSTQYLNLGLIYSELDFTEKSLEYYFKSLKIKEQNKDSVGSMYLYQNISGVLIDQSIKLNDAEKYLEKMLLYAQNLKDSTVIGDYYANMANLAAEKNDNTQRIILIKKALNIYRQINFKLHNPKVLSNLGNAYQDNKEYDKSASTYILGLQSSEEVGDMQQIAKIYLGLGKVMLFKNKYDSAKLCIDSAIYYSVQLEDRTIQYWAYKTYGEIYKSMGNYPLANRYMEKFINLKDSVQNETTLKNIARLQTEYQTTQKDLENQQLKTANLEQSQAQQQQLFIFAALFTVLMSAGGFLYYRNQQKAKQMEQERKLVQVNAENEANKKNVQDLETRNHSIGSQLHSYKGTLIHISEQVQDSNPQAAQQLAEVAVSIQAVTEQTYPPDIAAPLHQILLTRLAKYELSFEKQGTKLINDIAAIDKDLSKEVKLAYCRIFENILSNSYRHGKATEIHVSFFVDEKGLLLQVEDNGVGFDVANVKKNIGLNDYEMYAKYIKGKLNIDSQKGQGTTISLMLSTQFL